MDKLSYRKTLLPADIAGYLAQLPSPTAVVVEDTAIDDSIFVCIRDMKGLVRLDLSGTRITDAGMPELKRHQSLKVLHLANAKRLTEAGLTVLADLPDLQVLEVQ